jgi:two-component system cell cycle sensor histidine kinase/response regulator CckA
VVTADSGAEALSIYAERKTEIAAVITDMTMPMMRGVATTEALLRLNPDVKST